MALSKSPVALMSASLALAVSLFSLPASAQDGQDGEDKLAPLRDCRTIQQDADRLACFDAAVEDVIARQDSGEIQVVDREDIKQTRRSLFGFTLPRIGLFSTDDETENTKMQSTITGVRRLRGDYWEVEIAEGSVWRATNAPSRFKPKIGDEVELEKAAMTSYWLRLNGQNGVKATRIR